MPLLLACQGRDHGSRLSKAAVISNGLPSEFRPALAQRREEDKGKFIILSVGRIAHEKRHDKIIEAISKSKYRQDVQLVIAGSGDLAAEIAEKGKVLPNPPRMGYVSKEELLRLYRSSDLYVHASDVELEGMSVLEAIGCGLPALISDAEASASSQFALNSDFLFKAGDADSLAQKIDYWMEHRSELVEAGQLYAASAKKYYFEQSIDLMSRVLAKVAAPSKKSLALP